MPIVTVNGIRLAYEDHGSGPPIVLVTGANSRGRTWTLHQVPALVAAGYRAITVDNRGVPPTDAGPEPFTVEDMAADVAGLIAHLAIAPCRVVGFSLGGIIVQEMLIAESDVASQAVLMATRGRRDALREMIVNAERDLLDSGVELPPRYAAVVQAMQYLSPRTLNDDRKVLDWLDVFEFSQDPSISRAQQGLDTAANRLEECRKIRTECLAIGFRDDLIIPPYLCRELAEHIPGCRYVELADCGHYGHLEDPRAVNALILDFFATAGQGEAGHRP